MAVGRVGSFGGVGPAPSSVKFDLGQPASGAPASLAAVLNGAQAARGTTVLAKRPSATSDLGGRVTEPMFLAARPVSEQGQKAYLGA